MKKRKTIPAVSIVILVLSIILFSGCGEVNSFTCDNRLLGVWKNRRTDSEILIFYPDGSWDSTGHDKTWTIEDKKLVLTIEDENKIIYEYDYSFSNNNTLTLSNNRITNVYLKK